MRSGLAVVSRYLPLPQEYTLIKMEVVRPYPAHMAPALESYPHVYLVAATLRPETM